MTDVLSGLDSLFLHLDTPRTPMHVMSIATFEAGPLTDATGRVRIEDLRQGIVGRLDAVPKMRRRVRRAPFGLLPPIWEDDPDFDIATHVRRIAVASPGDDQRLLELCAEVLSWPLDRRRPLWELWFIEGVAGHRVAVVQKFHHALADGLSGAELALVLLDPSAEPAALPEALAWHPSASRPVVEAAGHDVAERGAEVRSWFSRILLDSLHPRRLVENLRDVGVGLGALVGRRALAPRVSVNAPIGLHRRLAVVRAPLDGLQAVANELHCTINDLLLTAVAAGIRHLLEHRSEGAAEVQVLVPVGLTHPHPADLGNHVSGMLVRLPLEPADPRALVEHVAAASSAAKHQHQSLAGHVLATALDVLAEPGLEAAGRLVQHQPLVNLVVTNVPGSPVPLYANGARMLEVVPVVPLAGNLSVGVAAFSYDGRLTVGIVADRDRCPDLAVLAAGMSTAFASLCPSKEGGRARRTETPATRGRTKATV